MTVELLNAGQCVKDKKYPLVDPTARRTLTGLVADELVAKTDGLLFQDGSAVLTNKSVNVQDVIGTVLAAREAGLLEETLRLRHVSVGQLTLRSKPDVSLRAPPRNNLDFAGGDDFAEYEANHGADSRLRQNVQAPESLGGWHAEVVTPRFQKFNVKIEFEVTVQYPTFPVTDAVFGVVIGCAYRGKEHMYTDDCARGVCVTLQIGEFDVNDNFTQRYSELDNTIMFQPSDINSTLYTPELWFIEEPASATPRTPFTSEVETVQKRIFDNVNGQFCVFDGKDADTGELHGKHALANFSILGVPSQYVFADESMSTLYELVCEKILADDGPTIVIGPNDSNRKPKLEGYGKLVVHALIDVDALITVRDVRANFHTACNYLLTCNFTAADVVNYIFQQEELNGAPRVLKMVNKWGKQDDGWFVMDNCAFKDGIVVPVSFSGHSVYHKYFTHNPYVPMSVSSFPRILVCPIPHVRYMILCMMWKDLMPLYFSNNVMPAKGVLSAAALGLHCHDFWNMVATLHGVPSLWVVSKEAGTGKTESFKLAQDMLGIGKRPIWGGDATKPATFDASVLDSGITKFIDDVVPFPGRSGPESKELAETVRAFYDGTGRQVCGKPMRDPQCALAYSSNDLVNRGDHPFHSRILTIEFEKLNVDEDDDMLLNTDDYALARRLMSCVLPDIEMIGKYNGTIDVEAITDCANWLSQVQSVKRYRPVNNSAKLMHIQLNMIAVTRGAPSEVKSFLSWIVNDVTRTICDLNKHNSLIDQFLVAVIEIREKISSNLLGSNPDRLIFWHNFRTEATPDMFPLMPGHREKEDMKKNADENSSGNTSWWSIRVETITHVIKTVLGRSFDAVEVYKAAKKHPEIVERAKSVFFADVYKMWPLKKSILCESTNTMIDAPLQESELLEGNMSREHCLMFKATYVNKLVASLKGCKSPDLDYQSVNVNSCNKHVGTYNFYNEVVDGTWFGFRGLEQSSFGMFCGATNKIDEMLISKDLERETRDAGFKSVMDCFAPSFIIERLTYTIPDDSNGLLTQYPPCWLRVPFATRDSSTDQPIVDPADFAAERAGSFIPDFRRAVTEYNQVGDGDSSDGDDDNHSMGFCEVLADDEPPRYRNPYLADDEVPAYVGPCAVPLDTPSPPYGEAAAVGSVRARSPSPSPSPAVKVQRRASPTNQARYPRPPRYQRTLADAISWGRYVRAGGPVLEVHGLVDELNEDDLESLGSALGDDVLDEEQVRSFKSVHLLRLITHLTLSCNAPHHTDT